MRSYETMFIVHPEVVGDELKALVEKFKGVIADRGGDVVKVEEWGSRTLAYPIQKLTRGAYFIFYFQAGPGDVAEFERRLRLDEKILRFNSLRLEQGLPQSVVAAQEAAEGAEAETAQEEAGE
ncbi:SSU ribosomal protein S6P [Geoalkalibacter ferrihydriticus]|uniref:Small ribosomal subunit protein bS6 n=2 Tax=Geoalkalibacter ferrihydriticus TaxID=392333 RepID=A0A0C2HU73_9BACT|nr:30S ribosomal protein S6 [Geoalkalibacter ferrihydriticus]KIH76387.1 30S ribosomal protein S6 [Geoalkalibacter ferrihydriticus DSM 17813]SDL91926.1 SSU ribosomal protein S6P [Geoalkalibacter ferrihydriticus]